MKISNRSGLPDALVRAIENDPYSKGDSEFSVTGLLTPPRQAVLRQRHAHEIVEDAEDRLWSLYGQIAHLILERANRTGLAEKRLFGVIAGTKISAQIDTLDLEGGVLSDWKFSSAYKFKQSEPSWEWTAQLNMQLELLRQNDMDAKELEIIGLLRDFSKMKAAREKDYPQFPVVQMPIQMWPREKTVAFIKDRIILHKQAVLSLPECTLEERWAKNEQWAVVKKGKKRALKLHNSYQEAHDHVGENTDYKIEHRPASAGTRCQFYCPASKFCEQYQRLSQLLTNEENDDEV